MTLACILVDEERAGLSRARRRRTNRQRKHLLPTSTTVAPPLLRIYRNAITGSKKDREPRNNTRAPSSTKQESLRQLPNPPPTPARPGSDTTRMTSPRICQKHVMDPLDARNLHHHCCRRRRCCCWRLCQSKDCRQSTGGRRQKHHEHRGILYRRWTTDDDLSAATAPLRALLLCASSAIPRCTREEEEALNQPPPGCQPHTSVPADVICTSYLAMAPSSERT